MNVGIKKYVVYYKKLIFSYLHIIVPCQACQRATEKHEIFAHTKKISTNIIHTLYINTENIFYKHFISAQFFFLLSCFS